MVFPNFLGQAILFLRKEGIVPFSKQKLKSREEKGQSLKKIKK